MSASIPFTVEDVHYHDENYDESNRAPPREAVEKAIRAFNEELDQLSRSFDTLSHNQRTSKLMSTPASHSSYRTAPGNHNAPSRAAYSSQYTPSQRSSASRRKPHPDPPPSVNRPSSAAEQNPFRDTPSRYSTTQPKSPFTPATERPPSPVETPATHRYQPQARGSSAPTPNRARRSEESSFLDDRSSSPYTHQPQCYDEGGNDSQWKGHLDHMRQMMEKQEAMIKRLQTENRSLRVQLEAVCAVQANNAGTNHVDTIEAQPYSEGRSSTSRQQPPPQQHRRRGTTRSGRSYASSSEIPFLSPPRATAPNASINSPPTRRPLHSTMPEWTSGDSSVPPTLSSFTPGTRFVAELATLLDMESGHHAPLSVLLDKHWDKLQHYFLDRQKQEERSSSYQQQGSHQERTCRS